MDRFEVAETGGGGLQTAQTDIAVVGGNMSNGTSASNGEVSLKSRTPHDNEYDTPPYVQVFAALCWLETEFVWLIRLM